MNHDDEIVQRIIKDSLAEYRDPSSDDVRAAVDRVRESVRAKAVELGRNMVKRDSIENLVPASRSRFRKLAIAVTSVAAVLLLGFLGWTISTGFEAAGTFEE